MLGKTVAAYLGVVSEVLLHDRKIECSREWKPRHKRLGSLCYSACVQLIWGRPGGLTGSKCGRKICSLALTRKHWCREQHKAETPWKCIFKVSRGVKMFIRWWALFYCFTCQNCFITRNKKYWTPVFFYFNHLKIKLAGSYWDGGFPLFLFHIFLGTIFLSKSLISGIFFKSNQWFQKNDAKNID